MSDEYRKAMLEAQRETETILAADPSRNISDPTLPIYRFVATVDLELERLRFEGGDRMAMLGAIRICANHDLVMPPWLAKAFIKSYDQALTFKVASWDDAFGRPLPKGKHLNAARKKRVKGMQVWLEVRRLHDEEGRAIDENLFADVGKALGLAKTLASEYYYSEARKWDMARIAPLLDSIELPQKSKTLRNYKKD